MHADPDRPSRRRKYVVLVLVLVLLLAAALVAGIVRGHDAQRRPGARAGDPTALTGRTALRSTTAGSEGPARTAAATPGAPPAPDQDGGTRRARRSESAGVVRIVVSRGRAGATATGIVLTRRGRIVTNRHVVAGADRIEITVMSTGRRYRARVVGTDRRHDVAVLRALGASGMRRVRVDRTALHVGQRVTAVGDAGGLRSHLTAAPGRIRSLDRRFVAPATPAEPAETLDGVDEVTCDVSPGDSGGPTYDGQGAVVAMTTGAVRYGAEPGGVVIPIATVLRAVRAIVG